MKVRMKFAKETKGALQYVEIDPNNNQLDMADAQIGTLYVRKKSDIGALAPKTIIVTVEQA